MAIGMPPKKVRPQDKRRPPVEKGRWAAKGTKPLPEQASIINILSVMIIHVCRKVLFLPTEVKITLYSCGLFFGSLVFDFLPVPKIYLATKDNFFNIYFVKFGWGWTCVLLGSFIYLTSNTYACGHKDIVKRHMSRLLIATVFWLTWTKVIFPYIENSTGACLGKAILKNKMACRNNGYQWHSFDISGHAFLLVYINLVLVEEAKAILGWEGIRDLLRVEEHNRLDGLKVVDEQTALGALSSIDLQILKESYFAWTPSIRLLFFLMTLISLLSDIMLAATVIYFHTMPQKVAGGIVAMGTWYFTYRFWYRRDGSPGLPGLGLFKYSEDKPREMNRRRSSITKDVSKDGTFMGMPLYKNNAEKEDSKSQADEPETSSHHKYVPRDYFSVEPRRRNN